MNPSEMIGKYLCDQIDEHKKDFEQVIGDVLGNNNGNFLSFLEKKSPFLFPIFYIDKNVLEHLLANDEIDEYDRKMYEYFLDEFDNPQKVIYGEDNFKQLVTWYPKGIVPNGDEVTNWFQDFFKIINVEILNEDNPSQLLGISDNLYLLYQHQLFDDEPISYYYIYMLLRFLPYNFENGKIINSMSNINLTNKQEINNFLNCLCRDIAFMCLKKLVEKGIYIIDTKEKINDYLNGYTENLPLKFYELFGDIIGLFLINPMQFINIVGENNFLDFLDSYEDFPEKIDEILEQMMIEREKNAKYEFVGINIPLIMKTKKDLAEKEKQEKERNARRTLNSDGHKYDGITSKPRDINMLNIQEKIDNIINDQDIINNDETYKKFK